VLAIKPATSIEELEEASVDAKALREESVRNVDRSGLPRRWATSRSPRGGANGK
jgi:hypothetical protein